jgi:hypothetical protein
MTGPQLIAARAFRLALFPGNCRKGIAATATRRWLHAVVQVSMKRLGVTLSGPSKK